MEPSETSSARNPTNNNICKSSSHTYSNKTDKPSFLNKVQNKYSKMNFTTKGSKLSLNAKLNESSKNKCNDTLIPSKAQSRTMYINKKILPSTFRSSAINNLGAVTKEKTIIYYNPKFIPKVPQNKDISKNSSEAACFRDNLYGMRKAKIHVNPKFLSDTTSTIPPDLFNQQTKLPCDECLPENTNKNERVYVNPKFFKNAAMTHRGNTPISHSPQTKPKMLADCDIIGSSTGCKELFQSYSQPDNSISSIQHKSSSSISLSCPSQFNKIHINPKYMEKFGSNGPEIRQCIWDLKNSPERTTLSTSKELAKNESLFVTQKSKFSIKRRRKSLIIKTPVNVDPVNQIPRRLSAEFKKTKYSIRRRKLPSQLDVICNIKLSSRKSMKKKKSSNPSGSTPGNNTCKPPTSKPSQLEGNIGFSGVRKRKSEDLDPFQSLGKTKLVRTSILQSQIMARRRTTSLKHNYVKKVIKPNQKLARLNSQLKGNLNLSKYKLIRKRCSSEMKKNDLVLSRKNLLKSRYKIIKEAGKNTTLPLAQRCFKSPKTTRSTKKKLLSKKRIIRPVLINIGGVLYRSTQHRLRKKSESGGPVVRVGDVKYTLGNSGRTLKRLESKDVKKVNFYGINSNILIKPNINRPKTLIQSAKRKSIAILTAKLRKRNEPCIFFIRFGYCKGAENGKCRGLHDRKYVTLCKQFLRGKCTSESCLLSHNPIPEKMPLCGYYLNGHCLSDDCPYLHINHGLKTPLCKLFLRGYCPKAKDCSKRHEFVCPAFALKGTCPIQKRCPYPHPKRYMATRLKKDKKEQKIQSQIKKRAGKSTPIKPQDGSKGDNSKESQPGEKANASEVSTSRYFTKNYYNSQSSDSDSDVEQNEEEAEVNNAVVIDSDGEEHPDPNLRRKTPFPNLPEYLPLS